MLFSYFSDMNRFQFYPKLALKFFLSFVLVTIIGTQLHELGHIAVAKMLGYDTELHYDSMNYYHKGYTDDEDVKKAIDLYVQNEKTPYEDWNESVKQEHKELSDSIKSKFDFNEQHQLLIRLGGPVQTFLTSVLGLFILNYRKSKHKTTFKIIDWIAVFMSLFILREVFNLVSALFYVIFFENKQFYGDEFIISEGFGMNQWVVPIMAAVIGIMIAGYVLLKMIPNNLRFTFIVSGFFGGLLGFALWFGFLGSWVFSFWDQN